MTGRVVDNANLLSPALEARLTELSGQLEQRTADELIVVTLPSLKDRPIEDIGYSLGNAWQIGKDDKDNGVLLIVAPNDRRVRIEVGHGLEPVLTNARAAEIIQTDLLPAFRRGAFEQGVAAGAEAISRTLTEQSASLRIGAC